MLRVAPDAVVRFQGSSFEAALSENEEHVSVYRDDRLLATVTWDRRKRKISAPFEPVPREIIAALSQRIRLARVQRALHHRAYQRLRHDAPVGFILNFKADPHLPVPPFDYRMRVAVKDGAYYTVFVALDNKALLFKDRSQIGKAEYDPSLRLLVNYEGLGIGFSVWARLVRQLTEYRVG